MIDVSEGPGIILSFWLAYGDKCLPHISHYLPIRQEDPLARAFCGTQKQPVLFPDPHCLSPLNPSIMLEVTGLLCCCSPLPVLTYAEQKYPYRRWRVKSCCYHSDKLRQKCVHAAQIRPQDDAVKDTHDVKGDL